MFSDLILRMRETRPFRFNPVFVLPQWNGHAHMKALVFLPQDGLLMIAPFQFW